MFRDYKIFYQKSIGLLLTETLISMAFILFIETVPLLIQILSAQSIESMLNDPEDLRFVKLITCIGTVSVSFMLLIFQISFNAEPYGCKLYKTVPYGAERLARAMLQNNLVYLALALICAAICIMPMALTGLFYGQVFISVVYSLSAVMTVSGIAASVSNIILCCKLEPNKRYAYLGVLILICFGLIGAALAPVFASEYTAGVSGAAAVIMTIAMIVSQLGGGYISGRFAAKRWNMQ